MQYLLEHEYGFDVDAIGFPSISGCHAILYLTINGLFGFHNAGGSGSGDWSVRGQGFATFVREHFVGNGNGLQLYGCTFAADNRRGYPDIGKSLQRWKDELQAFAAELNYTGPIKGYDLSTMGIGGTASAYVEYRASAGQCDVFVKQWTEAGKTTGLNDKRNNHKKRVGATPEQVITSVDRTGLVQVFPQPL